MSNSVKIMESNKIVLVDSLSVPKIIGKGPIIIAPPALTFFSLFILDIKRRSVTTRIIAIPVNINVIPKRRSVSASISLFGSSACLKAIKAF